MLSVHFNFSKKINVPELACFIMTFVQGESFLTCKGFSKDKQMLYLEKPIKYFTGFQAMLDNLNTSKSFDLKNLTDLVHELNIIWDMADTEHKTLIQARHAFTVDISEDLAFFEENLNDLYALRDILRYMLLMEPDDFSCYFSQE